MNFIHQRFSDSLLSILAQGRERQERFHRLLADRPTGTRIKVRGKRADADLKRSYAHTMARSSLISFLFMAALFLLYPKFEPSVYLGTARNPYIQIQDIPETVQRFQPETPRPAEPLAVEGEEVPEDVTIESTELDLDNIPVDLRLRGPMVMGPPVDEALDISEIEDKPKFVFWPLPEYPEAALKDKLEGIVNVRVLVGKDGRVEQVEVVGGTKLFFQAAVATARRYRFRPGKHEGEIRRVWMPMPIRFSLK